MENDMGEHKTSEKFYVPPDVQTDLLDAQNKDEVRLVICRFDLQRNCTSDTYAYNRYMRYAGLARKTARMFELYELMIEAGAVPNVRTFNNMLTTCCACTDMTNVERVWDLMRQHQVVPNIHSYEHLVFSYVRCGRLQEAYETYMNVWRVGYVPSINIYRALIRGYANSDRPAFAFDIFNIMVTQKCTPSQTIYDLLAEAIVKHNLFDKVPILLTSMQVTGIDVSDYALNKMVQQCCKQRRSDIAKDIFTFCRNRRISLNTMTYNMLIGKARNAEELRTIRQEVYTPDIATYLILIRQYNFLNKPHAAIDVFVDYLQSDCPWDERIISAMRTNGNSYAHISNMYRKEIDKKKERVYCKSQPREPTDRSERSQSCKPSNDDSVSLTIYDGSDGDDGACSE